MKIMPEFWSKEARREKRIAQLQDWGAVLIVVLFALPILWLVWSAAR